MVSQYLPDGWLCKDSSNKVGIDIVSPDRRRFYSYRKAADYMEANDGYSEEDVRRLFLYPDGQQHKDIRNYENTLHENQEWITRSLLVKQIVYLHSQLKVLQLVLPFNLF